MQRQGGHESLCANGISLAADASKANGTKQSDLFPGLIDPGALSAPCKEDAAGQSSHSADAEAGDMQEQQHTVIQQYWPSASVACHAVQGCTHATEGVWLSPCQFKAATESSAKPCLQIRLNESDVQTA